MKQSTSSSRLYTDKTYRVQYVYKIDFSKVTKFNKSLVNQYVKKIYLN